MSLPSIDELVPTDMNYACVDETPNCLELYVVDLDTQKVMDGVQSVDVEKGVAYCISQDDKSDCSTNTAIIHHRTNTKVVPVMGRYKICVINDCEHGFVVRDIQKGYRFLCKECDTRFCSYPMVRKNIATVGVGPQWRDDEI